MTGAPDYAAPVIGWRVWLAVEQGGEWRLRSAVYDVLWPPRERLAANCLSFRLRFGRARWPALHPVPAEGCACGIYAAQEAEPMALYLEQSHTSTGVFTGVIGQVALWGSVVECERGWRASFGYPTRLYVPEHLCAPAGWLSGRLPSTAEIARALGCYGVPVDTVAGCTQSELLSALQGAGASTWDPGAGSSR